MKRDRRFRNFFDPAQRQQLATVAKSLVCAVFISTPTIMDSAHRGRPSASEARQVAYYVCYHLLRLTQRDIARAFRRDRSTVQHGIKAVEAKLAANKALGGIVEHLRDLLARHGAIGGRPA